MACCTNQNYDIGIVHAQNDNEEVRWFIAFAKHILHNKDLTFSLVGDGGDNTENKTLKLAMQTIDNCYIVVFYCTPNYPECTFAMMHTEMGILKNFFGSSCCLVLNVIGNKEEFRHKMNVGTSTKALRDLYNPTSFVGIRNRYLGRNNQWREMDTDEFIDQIPHIEMDKRTRRFANKLRSILDLACGQMMLDTRGCQVHEFGRFDPTPLEINNNDNLFGKLTNGRPHIARPLDDLGSHRSENTDNVNDMDSEEPQINKWFQLRVLQENTVDLTHDEDDIFWGFENSRPQNAGGDMSNQCSENADSIIDMDSEPDESTINRFLLLRALQDNTVDLTAYNTNSALIPNVLSSVPYIYENQTQTTGTIEDFDIQRVQSSGNSSGHAALDCTDSTINECPTVLASGRLKLQKPRNTLLYVMCIFLVLNTMFCIMYNNYRFKLKVIIGVLIIPCFYAQKWMPSYCQSNKMSSSSETDCECHLYEAHSFAD